jgi:O-acetyl-ADP-ribose deacetylase (regulator of RNase III)
MAVWNWSIGTVSLQVRVGNLLEAPEPVWVNPENSAFRMAAGTRSVSGQLVARYPEIQRQLDRQTGGRTLPEGTVLMTASDNGPTLFHVGHHHPMHWLRWGRDVTQDDLSQHASIIARCVTEVLERVAKMQEEVAAGKAQGNFDAVAFPMVGTGSFGLDVERFAHLFFESVANFGRRATNPLRVVLVLWEDPHLEPVVRSGTQALASMLGGGESLLAGQGGHPLLEPLRKGVHSLSDPLLQEQRLLAFAEIALHTDLAVILQERACSIEDLMTGIDARRGGFAFTFGFIRDRLEREADKSCEALPPFLKERVKWLCRAEAREAMRNLTNDRNNFAHRRAPRHVDEIVKDIDGLFGPQALPEAWQVTPGGRWIREFDIEYGLADGIDLVRRKLHWLLPISRARRSDALD